MIKYLTKIFLMILTIFFSIYALLHCQDTPKGMFIKDKGALLVPESERQMDFVVVGLWPDEKQYFYLPELKWPSAATGEQKKKIAEKFYWLNFELSHGDLLKNLPKYTRIYAALPDKQYVPESEGHEKEYFISYLKAHCNFTDDDVKKRLYFFYSANVLEWPQDICKIIGIDSNHRIILGYSEGDTIPGYVLTVKRLVKAFPQTFTLWNFGTDVSAEGGDEDIIWTPDNKVALLAGRHRVIQFLNRNMGQQSFEQNSLAPSLIETVRKAFSDSVFGIKVLFVPEKLLLTPIPGSGSDEVFHLDMLACVLPNPGIGSPRVFIPTYMKMKQHYDSLLKNSFDKNFISRVQKEYDEASGEFKNLGYEVIRLPFSDHPVRNPVNIVRFRDKNTGKITVLLPKYPYFLPIDSPDTPQQQVLNALDWLRTNFSEWQNLPGPATYQRLADTLQYVFDTMDKVAALPNPIYDTQEKIFKKYGYEVIPIPSYTWGAGGPHCQLLY